MKLMVHTGSYSIDTISHSQAETDAMISAIVTAIPAVQYIAVATPLDYAADIGRWATSIHAAGKKLCLRSVGFNDWLGYNSTAQYTGADFTSHSDGKYQTFLNSNYTIFQAGDIFTPVPDEPENNGMWNTTYGTIGSGGGQTAFNSFITTSITNCTSTLSGHGVTGVELSVVATNPSCSKDVITNATATSLSAISTDDYPEGTGAGDPSQLALIFADELNQWIIPNKPSTPKHITFGPHVFLQLEQGRQAEAFGRYLFAIQKSISNLDGITIWNAGGTDNASKSRIFEYNSGVWTARTATKTINAYFAALTQASQPYKRIPVV